MSSSRAGRLNQRRLNPALRHLTPDRNFQFHFNPYRHRSIFTKDFMLCPNHGEPLSGAIGAGLQSGVKVTFTYVVRGPPRR
jgi:hypothetical protein